MISQTTEEIKAYYEKITKEMGGRMQTKVCHCGREQYPSYMKKLLELIPDEIEARSYGCGSPIPPCLDGCTILDLGCGTGRDAALISFLAGENGHVTGIDMSKDQLDTAEKYLRPVIDEWGYGNLSFVSGYIEDLASAGIADASVDVVISNCVINLSPDKERVFSEIWRVLKNGGELYFSDIFADRRVPEEVNRDPVLLSECLGGAMYVEDFRRLMRKTGFEDFRYVSVCPVTIDNEEVLQKTGNIHYTTRTVRAMKLPDYLEDICEQYGQVVTYRGGIRGQESAFTLDDHHAFEKGLPVNVCGNTCAMLEHTRFRSYFDILGNRDTHFGEFEGCGTSNVTASESTGGCCC